MSEETIYYKGGVIPVATPFDLLVEKLLPKDRIVTFQVSSAVLISASPFWSDLLLKSGRAQSLNTRQNLHQQELLIKNRAHHHTDIHPDLKVIRLEHSDTSRKAVPLCARCVGMLLDILHHRGGNINKCLRYPALLNMAILADRWHCRAAIEIYIENLMALEVDYRPETMDPMFKKSSEWIFMATVFRGIGGSSKPAIRGLKGMVLYSRFDQERNDDFWYLHSEKQGYVNGPLRLPLEEWGKVRIRLLPLQFMSESL